MNIRTLIKQSTPPLLLSLIKKASSPKSSKVRYSSYAEASSACQQDAYQNHELIKVVVEKNLIYREKIKTNPVFDLGSLRTLIALAASHTAGGLNVLDFGGGGGYHYTIAKTAVGADKSLRWCVVETPAMAAEARRLANDKLNFYDDLDKAKNELREIDLVFTSSTLQYCPEPLHALKQLIDLNAPFLFITRTPFTESSSQIVTVQSSQLSHNGPGPLPSGFKDRTLTYPVTYVNRLKVEEMIKEKYDIRFKVEEGEGVFHFGDELITMTGYFCAKK